MNATEMTTTRNHIASTFSFRLSLFEAAEAERIEDDKLATCITSHPFILVAGAATYRSTDDGHWVREALRPDLSNAMRYTRETAEALAAQITEACPGLDLCIVTARDARALVIMHLRDMLALTSSEV